jgi:cytochrome o ubiquinol oxidase operon protein cyoD
MSTQQSDPLQHPEVQQASLRGYISGYGVTLGGLGICLLITNAHVLSPIALLSTISALALVLLIAQAFLFFGLDFSQHNIWKTFSVILTVPLFVLSIGLTVWMFHDWNGLTMLPEMPGMPMQPTLLQ